MFTKKVNRWAFDAKRSAKTSCAAFAALAEILPVVTTRVLVMTSARKAATAVIWTTLTSGVI